MDKVRVFREFELWLSIHVVKWEVRGRREFTAWNHWLEAYEPMVFEFDEPEEDESFEV